MPRPKAQSQEPRERTLPAEEAAEKVAEKAWEPASTSRRRLLSIAGGLGGVVAAGAALGWALDRSGAKTPSGKLTGARSRPGSAVTATGTATGKTQAAKKSAGPPGKVLWRVGTESQVLSTLAVTSGVMVVSPTGHGVSAFDAATGAQLWTHPVRGNESGEIQAQGGTVILLGLGGGQQITGVATATGSQLWSDTFNASGARMAVGGDLCVVAADPALNPGPAVTAYSLSTGAKAWTFALPSELDTAVGFITSAGGDFYVADMLVNVWRLSAAGTVLTRAMAPAPWPGQLVVTDGILCGLADTAHPQGPNHLYGMDSSTGASLWNAVLDGSNTNTMTAADGVVFTAGPTSDGSALMTWNASTGAAGWQHHWSGDSAVDAPLAAGPGTVLVGIKQTLHCFSVTDGDELWQLTLGGGILTIEVAGGMAYVSTVSGWVYAVQL